MRWLIYPIALAAQPLAAQVQPAPGPGDQRLQIVTYAANQIVQLSVAPGFQLMVRLARGERIETIAVGDSAAWNVSAAKGGGFLFIKNNQARGLTNMAVITDARVYNFELVPGGTYGGSSAYEVKFVYPQPVTAVSVNAVGPSYAYRISGARNMRPDDVYQEGNTTVVEWSKDRPMAAVFAVEDGQEVLINGEMQNGRYIVEGTPEKLIFRLDKKAAYATRSKGLTVELAGEQAP